MGLSPDLLSCSVDLPVYSLEGLRMMLQYFRHLIGRANSLENTDVGKDRRQEEKGLTEKDKMVG